MQIIEAYAFATCTALGNVNIPDSVKSIGKYAFEDCGNLTDVYMKTISLDSIGETPFPIK